MCLKFITLKAREIPWVVIPNIQTTKAPENDLSSVQTSVLNYRFLSQITNISLNLSVIFLHLDAPTPKVIPSVPSYLDYSAYVEIFWPNSTQRNLLLLMFHFGLSSPLIRENPNIVNQDIAGVVRVAKEPPVPCAESIDAPSTQNVILIQAPITCLID